MGVLRPEPADFSKLDDAVRVALVNNKIYLRQRCKERLYLLITELGRGLHSVELQSEHILLQLLDGLENSKEISTKLATILKGFLKVKYRLIEEVTKKSLEEVQFAKLYNEIEKQKLHSKLYNARKNELVSVRNIRPRNEAVFCYIQDRNVFWGVDSVCRHCGKSGKTVDQIATAQKCQVMTIQSGIMKSHSMQKILHNKYADIRLIYKISIEIIPYAIPTNCIYLRILNGFPLSAKELESYQNQKRAANAPFKLSDDRGRGGSTLEELTININQKENIQRCENKV
ncbi:hypothetical protein CWI38_1681p0020 [Hamiltosporidium tvaerminnensis]|uniref:Uncharacterized protein n=1 Tax=Hamiltosporidium tvaerminnensis TaxID=1176355 RepID=A0A4Q9LS85_9MICR|nr:hypothetical protein CWI38_1681p0020 [Hamiltosporidium tvaerminnensis]